MEKTMNTFLPQNISSVICKYCLIYSVLLFKGGHILSGAVIDPISLNELIPDWKEKDAPLKTPVTTDKFAYLTETGRFTIPIMKGKLFASSISTIFF